MATARTTVTVIAFSLSKAQVIPGMKPILLPQY
jgi:hypothetical protein